MARYAISILLITTAFFAAASVVHGQKKKFDIEQVRNNFKIASTEYLELVGDEIAGLESEKRPDAYWLVRVRPKRTGHYAVKYVYKYDDPFYVAGENVINIGVGPKGCGRQARTEACIARFCLGDTVVLPVRAANRYDYSFSVKYTEENDPNINNQPLLDLGAEVAAMRASGDQVNNPLAANLKYLGTQRGENLHRNGGSTITYSATFRAVAPARFNLVLSSRYESESESAWPKVLRGGTPVIILEAGTPVTYLASHEDTINYADEKKFSSHSGGTFPTNLLVLQPGDVFSLRFAATRRGTQSTKMPVAGKASAPSEPVPVIQKAPFFIDRSWGYNQFVADFFIK
jgi:hypothetical protein